MKINLINLFVLIGAKPNYKVCFDNHTSDVEFRGTIAFGLA